MKPRIYHYALAHTFGFTGAVGVVASVALLLEGFRSEGVLIADWGVAIWIALATIPAAALGWLLGIIALGPWLFHIASKIQGAPFGVGDQVWILSGKHKGTLTNVYAVWAERGQVRVELGPEAREEVTDVLCILAVCRVKSAEPDAGAERHVLGDSIED